jgi:hypothetical protein
MLGISNSPILSTFGPSMSILLPILWSILLQLVEMKPVIPGRLRDPRSYVAHVVHDATRHGYFGFTNCCEVIAITATSHAKLSTWKSGLLSAR